MSNVINVITRDTHIDFLLVVYKEQDYQNLFFLGKTLSFMSFFLKLRLGVTKTRPQMSQWEHPISWGNGITLPHIYLVEPISEALHF